jgi:DNA-binding GntR family transcriptional regulator
MLAREMDTVADSRYPRRAVPGATEFVVLRRRTAEREIYEQLKRAILRSQLAPGAWLPQEELAEQFGVSRMPIRDALRMLSAEGLVELLPHRGARVAPLSAEELEELYAVRMGLECLAARLAAARMTPVVLERMAQALRWLGELGRSTDLEAYLEAEAEYHRVCYAASGRERLCRNVADLRQRADRYLRAVFDGPARFHESLRHQRRLYAACERRDGPGAERTLRSALRWTVRHAGELFARNVAPEAAGTAAGGRPRRRLAGA